MTHLDTDGEDRREFLKTAIASSGGHIVHGNNGYGNGGGDGSPNNKEDRDR
ncbi:hypothetical protein ACVWZK_006573 [Bradyrhizobium sp. GM0.4]